MKGFIEYLVKQIVSQPEKAFVEEVNEGGVLIEKINVASEDMGLIIGKEGRTIKSIRGLARSKAIIDNLRINIEVVEQNPIGNEADQNALVN